ncbi:MAG TPA: DUF1579 family protein, partial [Planctomycetota bacterium]|nr:DUF1579 family protein [Planctomycetota bacterium]
MQNPFMAAGGAVLFALGVAVGAGVFQDAKKEGGQDGANTMKPLDEHKWLASQVGTWKATMSMMTGPDQWERGVGTETVRMDCGGLWQISDFEMPKLGGMGAFKGHGVMGYDPDRKKFVGHWFDAWGYSPTAMEGTTDKD